MHMSGIAKLFVLLSLSLSPPPRLAFLMAVLGSWTGAIMGIGAEAYSRACTNLALMALSSVMIFPKEGSAS